MAYSFTRRPIIGADENTWGTLEQAQNQAVLSIYTAYVYNDSGTLKISAGQVGISDGTNNGVATSTTADTISIAGVSNSNWAYVLMSVSGAAVTLSAVDIAGQTDPDVFPPSVDGTWNGSRGGFYLTTNRILCVFYKNSGGAISLLYNAHKQFIDNNFVKLPKFAIFNSTSNQTPGAGWQTLTFNNQIMNEIANLAIGSNIITFPAGRYKIFAYCIFSVGGSAADKGFRIRDVSNNITVIQGIGLVTQTLTGINPIFTAIAKGIINIASTTNIEIQSYLTAGDVSNISGGLSSDCDLRRIIIEKVS